MLDSSALDKRFKKLFQDGKLVQVHVGKWGMSHQLSEDDIGINKDVKEGDEKTKLPSFVLLGKKWLFTPEVRLVFGRIESAARKFLADNSHKFEIADAHFVPQKLLVKVLTTLNEYKESYDKAVNDFIENYDKHKAEMFKAYPDHRAQLEPYYPPAEQIRPKFSFYITIFEVAFPKSLKSVSLVEVVAQNLAVEQAKKKYEAQMEAHFQQSMEQMTAFVKESAVALRSEVVKGFQALADKIANKEVVTATNLNSISKIVEEFEGLDFFDDLAVKEQLTKVKKLVKSGLNFKDDAEAIEKLQVAVSSVLDSAKKITDIDTVTGGYIRRLDVDDL